MTESNRPAEPAERGALDKDKRRIILAVLGNGNSRRAAATYAGCAPSTITRTIARDSTFAAQVAHAEQNAEIELLRCVRNACKEPRYSRAGAWCLERRNPEEFAPRPPLTFTRREIADLLVQVMDITFEDLPEEKIDLALERLNGLIEDIEDTRAGFPRPAAAPPPAAALPAPETTADEEAACGDGPTPAEGSGESCATRPQEDVSTCDQQPKLK